MSGHRSFNTLRQRMSPERRAANEAAAAEMHREYALNEIRREMGFTQAELAVQWISQNLNLDLFHLSVYPTVPSPLRALSGQYFI